MATIDEMHDVINNMVENDDKWVLRLLMETPRLLECSTVADVMVRALFQAEDNGRCYNDYYEQKYCTCWRVGDYIITYPSGYVDFSAGMLTEEMMYDLIIEEAKQ